MQQYEWEEKASWSAYAGYLKDNPEQAKQGFCNSNDIVITKEDIDKTLDSIGRSSLKEYYSKRFQYEKETGIKIDVCHDNEKFYEVPRFRKNFTAL